MKITWLGHACFLVETAEGSVLLDPYAPGSVPGLALPPVTADLVLCSHEHRDHGYRQAAALSGNKPTLRIETLDCFHDDRGGALRGKNRIHVLEAEGLRLAHLGDLGHEPSGAQYAQMGPVDALLIPVGGFYTIDAVQAAEAVCRIAPKVTIPMHYKTSYNSGWPISEVGPFWKALGIEPPVTVPILRITKEDVECCRPFCQFSEPKREEAK